MNIDSGIILPEGNRVVTAGSGLWLYSDDHAPTCISSRGRGMRFLASDRFGAYFAYWSDDGESFHLIDRAGEWLWSAWMNTDKCKPRAVRFSASGDALACEYDFEGAPGTFFCDIAAGKAQRLGCSGSPIGHDADMRRFVMNGFDRYEYSDFPFYSRDAAGVPVKVPQEEATELVKDHPAVIDRDRCLLNTPPPPVQGWDGLVLLDDGGYVLLDEGCLYWFAAGSDVPMATVRDMVPARELSGWWRCVLTATEDLALVQAGDRAVAVGRGGVIWRGSRLSSTMLDEGRILAIYRNGEIEVIRTDRTIEMRLPSPPHLDLLAARLTEGVLKTAYVSEYGNLRLQDHPLTTK